LIALNEFWEENLDNHFLNDVDFSWSPEWQDLIDAEAVFPLLDKLFNSKFQLDHMFGIDEHFMDNDGQLHDPANALEEGIFYHVQNKKVLNGLTSVLYALGDIDENVSHWCCIPGSHRANFALPAQYFDAQQNPLLRHFHLQKGDALVFSEALVHGSYSVASSRQRRAVLARYVSMYSYPYTLPEHHSGPRNPDTDAASHHPRWRDRVISAVKAKLHAPELKAKAALEALQGGQTNHELGQKYGVHPSVIGQWKREIQAYAASLFDGKSGHKAGDAEVLLEPMYKEIGRLKTEMDWLKRKLSQ
jgi:transposase-like protein